MPANEVISSGIKNISLEVGTSHLDIIVLYKEVAFNIHSFHILQVVRQ